MTDPLSDWTPAFTIDLKSCSAQAFSELVENFNEWAKEHPAAHSWVTGWHVITPQMAEDLLKRNKHNRKVSLETVRRYALAMAAGKWVKTGQPGLIDDTGEVFDIQHRAWAGYLSGYDFPSFIVTGIPHNPDLFAYLDGGKPRSAGDALYTAGANGLSSYIAQAVAIANRYDHGALGILKKPKITPLTPAEVLAYSREHPGLGEAAHIMASNYNRALQVIKSKGIGIFAGWKILEHFDMPTLDGFMVPLGSGANLDENDPILALRNRLMVVEEGKPDEMSPQDHRRLALLIKAFKLHQGGQTVGKRGLALRDNERFPSFEHNREPESELAAAE